jgi:hypothetical protein
MPTGSWVVWKDVVFCQMALGGSFPVGAFAFSQLQRSASVLRRRTIPCNPGSGWSARSNPSPGRIDRPLSPGNRTWRTQTSRTCPCDFRERCRLRLPGSSVILVAQTSNLPYRRLPIGGLPTFPVFRVCPTARAVLPPAMVQLNIDGDLIAPRNDRQNENRGGP